MSNKDKIYLVNETTIIDHSIHKEWLDCFTNELIPGIKNSGLVSDLIFSKIKDGHNPDGQTYALQLKVKESNFLSYKNHTDINKIRNKINTDFKNKFGSFETVLEIVID